MLAAEAAEAPGDDVPGLIAGLQRSRGVSAQHARMAAVEALAVQQLVERASALQRQLGIGPGEAIERARAMS